MPPKDWDRKRFNDDPKHESERRQFDEMVEDSFNRIAEKKKKENPPQAENKSFLDEVLEGIFGKD